MANNKISPGAKDMDGDAFLCVDSDSTGTVAGGDSTTDFRTLSSAEWSET